MGFFVGLLDFLLSAARRVADKVLEAIAQICLQAAWTCFCAGVLLAYVHYAFPHPAPLQPKPVPISAPAARPVVPGLLAPVYLAPHAPLENGR